MRILKTSREELLQVLGAELIAGCRDVTNVLESSDREPRAQFLKHFRKEIDVVTTSTALALAMFMIFLYRLEEDDTDRRRVMAVLHTAINLQVTSTKLFLLGHTVAAGTVFRQVIEGVGLALLCSVHSLGYFTRFEAGIYSANRAIADLKRHAAKANVRPEAMETMLAAYRFHHTYAHISRLTIAAGIDFSRGGTPHLGAHFDREKLQAYGNEARNRARFASRLPNAVFVVCRNLAQW